MKILLVEDTAEKRVRIKRAFRNKEAIFSQAKTLVEAKEILEENTDFDLIITDMYFPNESGELELKDAGEQLIHFASLKNLSIPIIICSRQRYRIEEKNVLGSVHFRESTNLEREFNRLLS